MSRTDRTMIAAAVLAVAVVVGTVATAVIAGRPNEDSDGIEFHEPESKEEKAAAAAAISYLRSLRQGRADAACRHAAERVATQLRCSAGPAVPRRLRMERNGDLTALDARVRGARANVWVSRGEPGAVQDLQLRQLGGTWR
jgi:hypothetical protein